MIEKDPYYEVGTIDNLVVSQSALKEIDPAKGGSPRKFKAFFEERRDTQTLPMLRGSIFHLWHENPDAFHISEDVKPPEKLGLVADLILEKYNTLDEQSQDELILMIDQHILAACRQVGWNNNYGDAAILKNAVGVGTYIKAVTNPANKGKIILTAVLKEQIVKCIASLEANQYARQVLFWRSEFSNIEYYKELDVYWTEVVNGIDLKFKAKIDDVLIDHDKKIIHINDLKTTSGSAYNFDPTFKQYRLDLQFFVYARALRQRFPQLNDYKFEFRNIVVETNGLFQTVVHKWHPTLIGDALFYFNDLCERVILGKGNNYTMSKEEVEGNGEIKHLTIDWK